MTRSGDLIRAARERAGLKQAELAKLLGVSRNTILNWEKHDLPPRNKLGKLQQVLKLDDDLHPRDVTDTTDPHRMSNQELIARLNALVSQLNAVTVEVARRLGDTEDTGRRRAPRHADESESAVFFEPPVNSGFHDPDAGDADDAARRHQSQRNRP